MPGPSERVRAAAVAIVVATASACGAGTSAGPREAVTRYGDALRERDAAAARSWMTARLAEGWSDESLAHAITRAGRELPTTPELAAPSALRETAVIDAGRGDRVVVAQSGEGWRVASGVFDALVLATPDDALAALRRGLGRRHLPLILRVLARETRSDVEAEMARVARSLDESAPTVELAGRTATVSLADGTVIELVREGDEWRVLDVR